jgi:acyl-CoA reductase-like NAD-dependent aldehyde dehydrogenase
MTAVAEVATTPMLIAAERRLARSGATLDTFDPATGELCGRIPNAGPDDIDAAVRAASTAFETWRETSPQERAACLLRFAALIEENAAELVALDVMENGSPVSMMRRDAFAAVGHLRYFAGLVLQLRGQTIPTDFDRLNYTLAQPYGVVGRIQPFNHPVLFAAANAAAPLAAGNTIVIKPSEHTSLGPLRLAELYAQAFPAGVVNVVTGDGETGDALVTHPDVRRIAFTGSAAIGRRIQERAATSAVKAISLELGGKNPIVVYPDADLDLAIDGALRGMAFTWQGQSCGSTSRLVVHRSVHDEFVERLAAAMRGLNQGMPTDESTDTGAIVHRRQYEKVLGYIELGKAEGLRLVTGGGRNEDPALAAGMFVQPTLFDHVDPDSRLAQEEIFGPVLVAMPFESDAEAIAIANNTCYGLTASAFTRDLARASRFARDVAAGYVWINDASRHTAGTSHGGWNESGIGNEEGIEELYSYTRHKNVHIRLG